MKKRVAAQGFAALLLVATPALSQPHGGPGGPGAPPGPPPSPIFRKFMADRQAGNKQAAVEDLRQGVAKGDPNAEAQLGELYKGMDAELGGAVPVDYAKSVALSRKAAAKGSTRAMTDLGSDYMRGTGVPKDNAKALQYFKRAAAAGDRKSPRYLGLVYEAGVNGAPDYAEAAKYYRQAADAGDITGQCLLGSLYERGLGLPADYGQAEKYYMLSVQRGDVIASGGMLALGNLYETRGDGKRNLQTAAVWYHHAEDAKNPTAQTELTRLAATPLPVGSMRNVCLAGHPG